jgi:hypothetical protein
MEAKFRKQFPSRKLLDIISSTRIWKIQHNAAVIIQRAWRAYLAEKNAEEKKSSPSLRSGESGGVGHAVNKIGQFFHVGDKGKRRKTIETPFIFTGRKSRAPDGNTTFGSL